MKYIDIVEFGGPDVLTLASGDSPEPGKGEVLVDVVAAGVNRPDVVQRQGHYPAPPGASPIPGLEVAGEISQLGEGVAKEGVAGWKVGDRVCALTNGGGYAQRVVVPASQCLPVPLGFSMVEAAALPETFFTVWSNVFDRCGLKSGDTFLVHGGSSGIGTSAIQMASAMGARVFTTAGSDEKCAVCESLGAEKAINYRDQDFVAELKAILGKRGIDVTLDMVGGDYIARNIKIAAMDGRIANIAYLNGSVAEVNFMHVMLKRLTLTGSTLRPQSEQTKALIAENLKSRIWPLLESGKIRPVIAGVFTLGNAAEAHRLMESSSHIGKIVLTMGGI
ncbi:MAG: NAD(P)H-quinone oxidoreductase [Proteobacteria bacterium]|nr:MAG: NAD(P)H-quinone oxidoreductase [Pseudomonadota bacterium]PIE40239.1 MAG: NAD(P)H-quinone oxidoreductase [Gammaproteobacteria bacterium]